MKVGDKGLKMSDGTVRHFKSKAARDNFEKVAQAVKHGFHPTAGSRSGEGRMQKAEMTKQRKQLK